MTDGACTKMSSTGMLRWEEQPMAWCSREQAQERSNKREGTVGASSSEMKMLKKANII